ncbi:MAG: hypothetical protein HC779_07940, partial [Phyllobacteriaceae bacterium]|nr:hypothetical protein [Phyllobacteriaceae bacterium]
HLLASELGVAPAVETVILAEQIRAVAPFESPVTQTGIPPVLTRFFGRQQESGRLVDFLHESIHNKLSEILKQLTVDAPRA